VEDPVEYRMQEISDIQVNSKAELPFASGLRSIRRSDPDVVMIGEIRVFETAKMSVKAALRDRTPRGGRAARFGVYHQFLHQHKKCIINQREVNQDTKSSAQALKHVLRQDPDVILVGEMRDLETISLAITAGETGHLVFGTLHTQDTPQTVDRIIDVFPPHQQHQVRTQLANALQGIITQTLIRRRDGKEWVVTCEVLVPTPGVRNLIREAKNHQIYSAMQTGGKIGMQTLDAALVELVRRGLISREDADKRSSNPEELKRLAGGGSIGTGAGGYTAPKR
jgi:twitching motility protein PilT